MYCKKCGIQLPDNIPFCTSCGEPQTPTVQVTNQTNVTVKAIKKRPGCLIAIGVVAAIIIIIAVISSLGSDNGTGEAGNTSPISEPQGDNGLTFDDVFEFDDLEIVLSSNISWAVVDNQFSEQYGKDVVVVPITVKNISDNTHGLNMFFYKLFGPQGTELPTVDFYFDNATISTGDLRPGASQTSNLYLLYDGDGDYYVEFEIFSNPIEVRLPIVK